MSRWHRSGRQYRRAYRLVSLYASREVDAALWEAVREKMTLDVRTRVEPDGCLTTWRCELLDQPWGELLEFLGRELKLPCDDTELGIGWRLNGVPS